MEIVCTDSRTLYRGMDIGTAKPSRADRAAVPHHLLDVADPNHVVTLAEFQSLAVGAIEEIRGRGSLPVLVGGTGLYIRAVVDGMTIPAAAPDWALRERLEDEERRHGPGVLHRRLLEVDPLAASRIHPRNVRRIIRALEVYTRTGSPISVSQRRASDTGPANASLAAPLMVALRLDRARLDERIDRRIEQQLVQGLMDEVRTLIRAGYSRAAPALQGLGYKEFIGHLAGEMTYDEALARLRRNTRRLVKRQMTWLRADARYRWVDVDERTPEVVAAEIRAMMQG